MSAHPDTRPRETARLASPGALLIASAVLLVAIYAAVAAISFRFGPETDQIKRPVLLVLALFAVAFGIYLLSIRFALICQDRRRLVVVILLAGLIMRAASLFSWPILEIDIYRYIWDGAVVSERVSPYRYSPEQVLGSSADVELAVDMRRLTELRDGDAVLGTILSRIHYAEIPTVYPPVSQAVFATAVAFTPPNKGVFTYVVAMKLVLVLFDMATLVVIVGLLKLAKKHVGWAVAYGWCPLVIKEISNSGHLDSIAVFLTMLALYLALKSLVSDHAGRVRTMLSSVVLALAVGAKLYPVVLALMLIWTWARARGWPWATVCTGVFIAASTVILWPMVPIEEAKPQTGETNESVDGSLPPLPTDTADLAPQDPSSGLRAFLGRWEMNDLLFMIVVENLRPSSHLEPGQRPWFSVVPERWKAGLLSILRDRLGLEDGQAAFALARLLTAGAFGLIVVLLIWKTRLSKEPADWARVAFLTLAWFWLLSPTQNPWYWIWALPLIPFARSRAWLAVSGLAMIYYLRFWLIYQWPQQPLLGTPYAGAALFDYVVTWLEFGPWYLWLAIETFLSRSRSEV